MKQEDYRRAFDQISFSADFQERTANLLRLRTQELEKERNTMTFSKPKKLAVLIAACAALLAVSVSAAMLWLTPSQAANDIFEDPTLAAAFAGEDAILLNETVESGDFSITLLGLVSGRDLSDWGPVDTEKDRTYAMVALNRLDGEPLEQQSFGFSDYTLTPLVAGMAPWRVNNWTLDAVAHGGAENGTYYYLLDVQNLEIFADRTVYLAFYEGMVPARGDFAIAEDGTFTFAEDYPGVHALFTLPLDAGRADPEAVERFLAENPLTADGSWDVRNLPPLEEPEEVPDYEVTERETENGKEVFLCPVEE